MATFAGRIRKAFNSQPTLQKQREHSAGPTATRLTGAPGAQSDPSHMERRRVRSHTVSETRESQRTTPFAWCKSLASGLGIARTSSARQSTRTSPSDVHG